MSIIQDIVYVDMDGVIADFYGMVKILKPDIGDLYSEESRNVVHKLMVENKGFFLSLNPVKNAIVSVKKLTEIFDVYVLTAPHWESPHSFIEKRLWIEKYFGNIFKNKLIMSNNKRLLRGSYLIDDLGSGINHGAHEFEGMLIHFGSTDFPDWKSVMSLFISMKDLNFENNK